MHVPSNPQNDMPGAPVVTVSSPNFYYSLPFQPYHPHIIPNKLSRIIKLAALNINIDATKHFF